MKKEELQTALMMASLCTVLYQITDLLDEFCIAEDFPEEFQDDIKNFAETSKHLDKRCKKYFDEIRKTIGE